MENKIKEQEQFLIGHSEKDLYKVWANSVVISLNQAQKLIKTFKKMKIREGKDCLIFEDTSFLVFREIGKQHEYRILKSKKKKDTSKQGQESPAIKDNGSGKVTPLVNNGGKFNGNN